MLDANLTEQLKDHLTKVTRPVELVASLDDGPKSTELWDLLGEIAALSEEISLRRSEDPAERTPGFSIVRVGSDVSVGFAGIPMGHEFTSLVLALLQAGGHPPSVSDATTHAVQELEGEFHFETYMSLSCQNCPDVVQALNAMSVLNPNITHVAIDGALFPEEVQRHNVLAVPTVMHNQRASKLVGASQPGGLAAVELASGATVEARTVITPGSLPAPSSSRSAVRSSSTLAGRHRSQACSPPAIAPRPPTSRS